MARESLLRDFNHTFDNTCQELLDKNVHLSQGKFKV